MNMMSIDKVCKINNQELSGEYYFASIMERAYSLGLINNDEVETVQMQCVGLLSKRCEVYSNGESSSIRVKVAESIMKSNIFTMGLYLKSLPDTEFAVDELKNPLASEMYKKGRKLIDSRIHTARHLYILVEHNKTATPNYTYNATVSEEGIAAFFRLYDPDYKAHECPASIDYQLCNPVVDLAGVEYIQRYLENLYLENVFCSNFDPRDIHCLLLGYDEGYNDLLINIFEHVLIGALGCCILDRRINSLNVSKEEIVYLQGELSREDDNVISLRIKDAAVKLIGELNIVDISLKRYIEKSLLKITQNIIQAVRTNTLDKVFVYPINPDMKPKIHFTTGVRMDDGEYRKFIDELVTCRYSTDKIAFIREKAKSLGDIEDVLFDGELSEKEIYMVFDMLEDIEMAFLYRKYPIIPDVAAVDLSEKEQRLCRYINNYVAAFDEKRKERILELVHQIKLD